MVRAIGGRALLALITLACVGCSTAPATEIVVLVRVEPGLAPSTIEIEVTEPDGDVLTSEVDFPDLEGSDATLGVRHRGGALTPLAIEARATVPAGIVFDRAVTSFVGGERRLLVLTLRAACVAVTCDDSSTTCDVAGACVSAARSGESLPRFVSEGDLDAGVRRDTDPREGDGSVDRDAGELTGTPCLISANCFASERCVETASAGRCAELGPGSVGTSCTSGHDCESGVCLGVPGAAVCMDQCSNNLDCGDGLRCVASGLTSYDGACLPEAMSPCAGCGDILAACVVMRTGAPICTTGPLCLYGVRCDAGETCALLAQSEGGQAACRVGGACSTDDMSIDALGVERCGNTYACTDDADCSTDHPECLPGAAFGLSPARAADLGLCVRQL